MRSWFKASCILTAIGLTACAASPTGRNQILLFSSNDMSNLGAQSFTQMKQDTPINQDAKTNAYVQCVANAITAQVPKQAGFEQWEVVVFNSDQVNAFALPGGKIGVYTGLLKVAVNQDQLATVLGHEVAHVLANHSNERLSQTQLASVGLQVTDMAIGSSAYAQYKDITMAALGVGVQYGVILPYGRSQESEADIVGLEIMAKAGFDPRQSIELWKNMAKASGGNQPPELLSTHPSHSTRIQDLTAMIKKLPSYSVPHPQCG
ncbi:M48 family metallopeptidase [Vibrio fluvialis]|uniref:M48 family metallopeptidase n=1 Tax=Vibrio fluvialis TaxID=676 RepID=UPI0003577733|nr:M48 family metallopeptidase [Vibrio fluvialis]EKO3404458.1 M48 family metallopeptidase [Vibrio fluvialis]EPP20633.1 Zn-dependent protease with chaperone function [Vibrio fluvialis I21563]MBY7847954.1 M48 family metallopeptidase [Vibrio fluvialis]MBY7930806.1 M48 family metallopeptidase [Vibrio fluvialis]MBY7957160.1 M48 family metallopeptidase [Vibrio fluvialis]